MNNSPTEIELQEWFTRLTNIPPNPYHPLVWIVGKPEIGKNVTIGGLSEIQANNSNVTIGDNCDIASFVAINSADSHPRCIGLDTEIKRGDITIENNVFIGSGEVFIGHHSVIAAGTIIIGPIKIPPYSLAVGNPAEVKKNYYKEKIKMKNMKD